MVGLVNSFIPGHQEIARNRLIALRKTRDQRDPQPTLVPDSDTTAAIMQAQGLDPSVVGLSNESQDQDLPVEPVYNPPTDSMTGRFLLRRALEASRKPIDMQRFEQLAQDRQRAGDFSTLTSLYAGEAGPRYSGYQEAYLKKALGEQGDKQLGDYGFASGGEFYETPGIQQAREQEADFAAAELLNEQEEFFRKQQRQDLEDARIKQAQIAEGTYKALDGRAFVDDAINKIDKIADFSILRMGQGLIYGTDEYDFKNLLDTIKANIGFSELNAIRTAIGNKTGGALGNVTERELKFLQQVRGSLNFGQSKEALLSNLQNVQRSYNNIIRVLNDEKPIQRSPAGFEINGVPFDGNAGDPPDGAVQRLD